MTHKLIHHHGQYESFNIKNSPPFTKQQKLRYICQVVFCRIKVALTCSIICLPFLLLAGSQVSEVSLSSLSQASSPALIQSIQLPMNSVAAFQMSNSHIACFLILLMNNKRCYIANLFFLFLICLAVKRW